MFILTISPNSISIILKYLIAIISLSLASQLFAQNTITSYYDEEQLIYEDHIYLLGIKTVRLHPVDNDLAIPAIKLRSNERLLLSFDDLYEEYTQLSYTVVHCNADWTPSNLLKQEYLSNFQEFYIQNYQYSINALVPYTHYQLELPNNEIGFTKSGNYLLKVYTNESQNNLVLTRCFMIYEDIVSIDAQVRRATQVENMVSRQEIDFTIHHNGYIIQDPFRDFKVVLMQNQRNDNAITNLKPQFLQNSQLIYQYDRENTFEGINEFRFFDIKELQTLTQNVRRINRDSVYTAYLRVDKPRNISRYAVYFDINGQYTIRRLDASNSRFEADYAYVDFILEYPAPMEYGDVYIFGKITDWKLLPEFKMQYDYSRRAYRAKILLKQGYYNYMYAIMTDGKRGVDIETIEGSYWETENTYQFFIYNREIGQRYDRLIGFSEVSSEDLY